MFRSRRERGGSPDVMKLEKVCMIFGLERVKQSLFIFPLFTKKFMSVVFLD